MTGSMSFQDEVYSSSRSDVAFLTQALALPGPGIETSFGPFFTGNIDAIKTNLFSATQSCLCKLDFYADQNVSIFMQAHQFVVRNGGQINTAWPVLGAWCMFRVTPNTAAMTMTARISSSPKAHKPMAGSNQNILFSVGTTNVLAGATNIHTVFQTYPGPAYWQMGYITNDAAAWEAFLECESESSAVTLLDYGHSASGRINRQVFLPARPCRIRITNLDGAGAHNYNTTLVGDPNLFG